MARILYTGSVAEIRGSIAGSTYQRNRAGTIVRKRTFARFSGSPEQNDQKVLLATIAAKWSILTIAQKTFFENEALDLVYVDKFGQSKTLNGYQYYQLVNQNRSILGLDLLTSPVSGAVQPDLCYTEITCNLSGLFIDLDARIYGTDYAQVFYVSAPLRKSRSEARPLCILLGFEEMVTQRLQVDITDLYNSRFGVDVVSLVNSSQFNICARGMTIHKPSGLSSMLTIFYSSD
jgi:hypothetical protein